MNQEEARDSAFCCFGLLVSPDALDKVLSLLPPARQEKLRESMRQAQGLSAKELTEKLRHLREESTAAELRRVAAHANVRSLETLPPAIAQWLRVRAQESHGRKNHQG